MKHMNKILAVGLLVVAFQNCAPQSLEFAKSTQVSQAVPPEEEVLNCFGRTEGTTWWVPSNEVISENGVCEFGGDLNYSYSKNVELICTNGNAVLTGQWQKGNLISTAGACLPATCNGKVSGSTWSVPNGTLSEPKNCPSSSVIVNAIYNKNDLFICENGKENFVKSEKGSYIGLDKSCPSPDLNASFSSSTVAINGTAGLITEGFNVSTMAYTCSDGQTGSLPVAATSTNIKITQDLACTVKGTNAIGESVSKTASISVTCGSNEVKSGGKCIVYACKSFVEITSFPVVIPERTEAGVCYYAKLFNKIAASASSGDRLSFVSARNHSGSPGASGTAVTNVAAPYVMGAFTNKVTLQGERSVKLSGSSNALTSILVDNFVLMGSRLASSTAAISNYRAFGSADAAIGTTGKIKVNGNDVALQAFESGGTATIGTLLLTNDFSVGKQYELNVNALDCGGSKALSDIYLVFQ
ncbi:hypothetical protein ACLVWU_16550 [Bdellovibrio sp. HCB290]|uniref:hypothetical protein n=1 Tax=Bdellovibrio sp. HCB290 TaxID=3394356 RepID=UPI0039B3C7C1